MSFATLAHFMMVGRSMHREVNTLRTTAPQSGLMISESFDVSEVLSEESRDAARTAITYQLFFVFETYLRDLILTVLSEANKETWWDSVPANVRDDVSKLEENEDKKRWMNIDSRGKLSLTTLPQLLSIIDDPANWKAHFEPIVRDKQLIQQTRLVVHTRNTICHMSPVTVEEHERVQQVIRDWFRVVAP
jgi:hypothetical protein